MRPDGEDDDVPHEPPAPRRRFVSVADQMREMLAGVGIELDPDGDDRDVKPPNLQLKVEVDRVAIRAILVLRGAPARSISWLSASCPSLAHAEAYEPPRKPKRKGYPSVSDSHVTSAKEPIE